MMYMSAWYPEKTGIFQIRQVQFQISGHHLIRFLGYQNELIEGGGGIISSVFLFFFLIDEGKFY